MTAVLTLVAGLGGLLAAGHVVVRNASLIGARFGLQPMVIGLTVVAAGTSAPELAVVGQAVRVDDTELAVGSIIGSNIANVLLVLGLAATFGTIRVASRLVRIDIPVMIGASVLLLLFALDGGIGRGDGAMFLVALVIFVTWTLRTARREAPGPSRLGNHPLVNSAGSTAGLAIALLGATVILAVAARFVVSGAESIASAVGVPDLVIGLTVVALGTSAPEIVTTLIAALQGRRDLAVGNAVGSNIFNILLVLGATGLLAPSGIAVSNDALRLDIPVLLAAAVACLPLVAWDYKLDRWEGGVFVAYYLAYLAFLVLDGTGHEAASLFGFVMGVFVAPLTVLTVAVVIIRQRAGSVSARRDDAGGWV